MIYKIVPEYQNNENKPYWSGLRVAFLLSILLTVVAEIAIFAFIEVITVSLECGNGGPIFGPGDPFLCKVMIVFLALKYAIIISQIVILTCVKNNGSLSAWKVINYVSIGVLILEGAIAFLDDKFLCTAFIGPLITSIVGIFLLDDI